MITHGPGDGVELAIPEVEHSMPPSNSQSRLGLLTVRLNQWICGLHGHHAELQMASDRVRLRCQYCGHESPGWLLGRVFPSDTRVDLARSAAVTDEQFAG